MKLFLKALSWILIAAFFSTPIVARAVSKILEPVNTIHVTENNIEFSVKIESEKEALLFAKAINFYPLESMKDLNQRFKSQGSEFYKGSIEWYSSAKRTEGDPDIWEIAYKSGSLPSMSCSGKLSSEGVIVKPIRCGHNK